MSVYVTEMSKLNEESLRVESGVYLDFDLTSADAEELLREFENGDLLVNDEDNDNFYQLKSRPVSER